MSRRRALLTSAVLALTTLFPVISTATSTSSTSQQTSSSEPPAQSSSQTPTTNIPTIPVSLPNNTPTQGSDSFWRSDFYRAKYQSSLVVDDTLYVDGGEIWNSTWIVAMGSTVGIDLKTSWTPATVKPSFIVDHGVGFPLSMNPYMWYNPTEKVIQAWPAVLYPIGGPVTAVWGVKIQDFLPGDSGEPYNLWQLDPGNGNWKLSPDQPPSDYMEDYYGFMIGAASSDAWIGLGGVSSVFKWRHSAPAYNRLLNFQFSDKTWTNTSSNDYGRAGYGLGGTAQFTRLFGDEGVIIYLAGFAPHDEVFSTGYSSQLQDMSIITIFDIASGRFWEQTATAANNHGIPPRRAFTCSVLASDGSGNVDIFIFGGVGGDNKNDLNEAGQGYNKYLASVWVLSIPSFVWTWAPDSTQYMRAAHTCQASKRYLISVGGEDTGNPLNKLPIADPWPNGIGVFDMTSLGWKSNYDPSTGAYERASMIAAVAKKTPSPKTWNSNQVHAIFNSSYTPPSHSNHAGAIAGGVVGGVAVIVLLLIAGFILWRRRQRQKAKSDSIYSVPEAAEKSRHELDTSEKGPVEAFGQTRQELGGQNIIEKDAQGPGPTSLYEMDAASPDEHQVKSLNGEQPSSSSE